jgi:cellobiose-specific phosphotransferase system component IIA
MALVTKENKFMTLKEKKELEEAIANDILSNIQFSLVHQIVAGEAKDRAKKFVSEATEEDLAKVKKGMEEAEAAMAEAEAENKIAT